jgi:hypothetical protein
VNVEIDMYKMLSDDGSTLGVFLYLADAGQRSDLQDFLVREGAQFGTYPCGDLSGPICGGRVMVTSTSLTVLIRELFITAPMETSLREADAERAAVFVLDRPFDPDDKEERVVLSANLPLEVFEVAGT